MAEKKSQEELLDEAIERARDLAHTSRDRDEKEQQCQLVGWLVELRLRRSHTPLFCRMGLHKTTVGMGLLAPPFLETCVRCGKSWYSM